MKKIYKTIPTVLAIPAIVLNLGITEVHSQDTTPVFKEVETQTVNSKINTNNIESDTLLVRDFYKQYLINQSEKYAKEQVAKEQKEKEREENIKRMETVTYDRTNVTVPSHLTRHEMYILLSNKQNGSMAHLAGTFVEAEEKYGVNAFFLAGLAALEGNWGRSNRAQNQNNLTGMSVYGDDSPGTYYNSQQECILDTARQLKKFYLTPTNEYHNFYKGLSSSDIEKSYCAKTDWNEQIDSIANGLVNDYHKTFSEIYK